MAYPAIERHQRVISEPVYLTTGFEQNLALQDVDGNGSVRLMRLYRPAGAEPD